MYFIERLRVSIMIRLATVFSGIGAAEYALKRTGYEFNIVFACDNGGRKCRKDRRYQIKT